jgi:hypothetical protein
MTFRDTTEYSSTKVRTIKNQNKFRAHEPRTVKNNVVKKQSFHLAQKQRQDVKNFKRKNSIHRNHYL